MKSIKNIKIPLSEASQHYIFTSEWEDYTTVYQMILNDIKQSSNLLSYRSAAHCQDKGFRTHYSTRQGVSRRICYIQTNAFLQMNIINN